jgi:hypothetical protein
VERGDCRSHELRRAAVKSGRPKLASSPREWRPLEGARGRAKGGGAMTARNRTREQQGRRTAVAELGRRRQWRGGCGLCCGRCWRGEKQNGRARRGEGAVGRLGGVARRWGPRRATCTPATASGLHAATAV